MICVLLFIYRRSFGAREFHGIEGIDYETRSVGSVFMNKKPLLLFCVLILLFAAMQCSTALGEDTVYSCEVCPLERNGIALHLDCMKTGNSHPSKNILLIHGSTYSSHEFDSSPKGWSKDAFVEESTLLIHLDQISAPMLIIYGDRDPYMNTGLLRDALALLPEGSAQQVIRGGSHIMMYEKNCCHVFQDSIVAFLEK